MLIASAVVLCLGLAGCGNSQSDETVIRDAVTKELEALKTLDMETISSGLGNLAGSSQLEAMGINTSDYLAACFEGFDYSVNDVKVEGNEAKVKVSLTVKRFMDAMLMDQEQIIEDIVAGKLETGDLSSIDDIYATVGTYVMDSIKNAAPQTTDIELTYSKNGNVWTPGASYQAALLSAFSSEGTADATVE